MHACIYVCRKDRICAAADKVKKRQIENRAKMALRGMYACMYLCMYVG